MNQVRCHACRGMSHLFAVFQGFPDPNSLVLRCAKCETDTVVTITQQVSWRKPSDFGGAADEAGLKDGGPFSTDIAFPEEDR